MQYNMKKVIAIFSILINLNNIQAQSIIKDSSIQVRLNDKIGFIDFEGKEIVPLQFDATGYFSEGFIAVNKGAIEKDYDMVGGKWGYWSKEGKEIIPLKYENAKSFQEGLAPVKLNGKYGFINANAEVKIEFQYEDANPFQEGLAAVKLNKKWGFINKEGQLIIKPLFDDVSSFSNGHSVVFHLIALEEYEDDGEIIVEGYGKHGLIDTKGNLKLDTIYDNIYPYKNGFAKITLADKTGFINTDGKIVIPISFDGANDFSEGLAAVSKRIPNNSNGFSTGTRKYGYINEKGKLVIDYLYDGANDFKNGLAQVSIGDPYMQQFVFIPVDKDGNESMTRQEELGLGMNLIDKQGKLQLDKNQLMLFRYKDDKLFITRSYKGAKASTENFEDLLPKTYQTLNYVGQGYFFAKEKRTERKLLIKNGQEVELDKNIKSVRIALGNNMLVDYIVSENGNNQTLKRGIINDKGEWVVKPIYDFAFSTLELLNLKY